MCYKFQQMNHTGNRPLVTFVNKRTNDASHFVGNSCSIEKFKSDAAMRNNVLLLLNDKKERCALSKNLERDYHVYTAGGKSELLKLVDSASIQLIICGVDLPECNGWAICRHLRSSFEYAHIPIILLTTEDSLISRIKSLEAGADACLRRPFSWKYLEAQIKNLIANRLKITAHYAFSQPAREATAACTNLKENFIKNLNDCIVENMHHNTLDVDLLARAMNMSRPTLYRRIRDTLGQTPNELINVTRLNRAARLLQFTDHKVFEIAAMLGFSSQSSFGKAFVKHFSITPTEFQRRTKKAETTHRNILQDAFNLHYEKALYAY